MDESSFGGRVGELAVAASLHNARDGSDVDDGRREAGCAFQRFGEERQETGGHEELRGHVGGECISPGLRVGFPHVVRY